jgi:hypothetical protein
MSDSWVTHSDMEYNYRCSICGKQTGRKENATRHLRLVHDGNGEVIDMTGQSRGVSIPAVPSKYQKLLNRIEMLHSEEYIRELARLKAREDYKFQGGKSIYMDYDLLLAIKHMKWAVSSDSTSISKLIEELTGVDAYVGQSEKRKKTILDQKILELIKDRHE